MLRRTFVISLLAIGVGCSPAGEDAAARERSAALDRGNELRPISATEPAPRFQLQTLSGKRIDSAQLIGKRAFVFVFFATWCGVCERKLPEVQRALHVAGEGVLAVGVPVDDESTWEHVPGFVRRFDIGLPLVRGLDHRRFASSYDPFDAVPAVIVVGRNGYVLDAQVGWAPSHYRRLLVALELARTIPHDMQPRAEEQP